MALVFPRCHQFLLQQFSAAVAPLVGVGSVCPLASPVKGHGYKGSFRDCPEANQTPTFICSQKRRRRLWFDVLCCRYTTIQLPVGSDCDMDCHQWYPPSQVGTEKQFSSNFFGCSKLLNCKVFFRRNPIANPVSPVRLRTAPPEILNEINKLATFGWLFCLQISG